MIAFLRHYLPIIFLASFAASCEDVVDLPLDDHEEVVVFSNFSEKGLEVYVYKTVSIFDNHPTEYVTDASVKVFADEVLIDSLVLELPSNENHPPFYKTTQLIPEFDKEYTIRVEIPNYKTITAKNSIPSPVALTASTFDPTVSEVDDSIRSVNFAISVSLTDPHKIKNYYHIRFFQEFTPYSLELNGDTINGTVFWATPSSVESLNENGQLVKNQVDQSFLVSDTDFDGDAITLYFKGNFTFNTSQLKPGRFFIEFRTVSQDYFFYHTSINRNQWDGPPIGKDDVPFDNIDNGVGVFAGFTSSITEFKLPN